MQITTHHGTGHVELRIAGRIDATWAEHLGAAIESTVRSGGHHLVLNFAEVEYISSLGIRVLLVQYKLLKSVNGSLIICQPSEFCRNIFTIVGLTELIVEDATPVPASKTAIPKQRLGAADYEIYPQSVSRPLTCQLVGDPALLTTTGFSSHHSATIQFPSGTFAVGLGAFGQNFADCIDRFGEFLAAGGCAISLPTNEPHAHPDYVVEEGHLVPQMEVLYALTGEGDFSTMVRFDAASDGPGKVPLSELIEHLVDISAANAIGFVIMAEASGLIGAALRRSPAGSPLANQLPAMRDWLTFTTERTAEKNLCLIVGVASRTTDKSAEPFLRPLKSGSHTKAHMHGAAFPYRPVQKGELPFSNAIADLLSTSSPYTVLHLMADARPFEGVGETELTRGACWIGPLSMLSRSTHP